MFYETEVMKVLSTETPSVAILDVAMAVKTVTVPVFETVENGVVDCFTMLVADSSVWPEVTEVTVSERI